ncbi:MAG: class I SAM-dependent methyltransferase [Flavobacteriaceae bacterium]|nr:class I SAM-dependent methyltransferase [Flavobacteriaceae bacterium]
MTEKQKNTFLNQEGDQWFKRNKPFFSKNSHSIAECILPFINDENKILEVGSSDGTKLNYISQKLSNFSLDLYGVDPSKEAIKSGNSEFPELKLSIGTSDHLEFTNNFFDLIIIGSCFYLIDRELIYKTISEIDRLLKEGGYLVITDFDTPYPVKLKYGHSNGMFSYKNDYSNFFLGGCHYDLIQKIPHGNSKNNFDSHINDRTSTSILYKELISDIYIS